MRGFSWTHFFLWLIFYMRSLLNKIHSSANLAHFYIHEKLNGRYWGMWNFIICLNFTNIWRKDMILVSNTRFWGQEILWDCFQCSNWCRPSWITKWLASNLKVIQLFTLDTWSWCLITCSVVKESVEILFSGLTGV